MMLLYNTYLNLEDEMRNNTSDDLKPSIYEYDKIIIMRVREREMKYNSSNKITIVIIIIGL